MKRQKYNQEFKFNVVLETIKEDEISSVARRHGINTNLVSRWRKEFLSKGDKIFNPNAIDETKKLKNQISDLERMLGKKEVELGLLKNFADFYESRGGN